VTEQYNLQGTCVYFKQRALSEVSCAFPLCWKEPLQKYNDKEKGKLGIRVFLPDRTQTGRTKLILNR
jgi:hypothetical protein